MRTTRTELVEKQITSYSCDICNWKTENNRGCCGSAPIMTCHFCKKDCCRDCRTTYWENEWSDDRPTLLVCNQCKPKADLIWEIVLDTAGRYDYLLGVIDSVYENFDEYKAQHNEYMKFLESL